MRTPNPYVPLFRISMEAAHDSSFLPMTSYPLCLRSVSFPTQPFAFVLFPVVLSQVVTTQWTNSQLLCTNSPHLLFSLCWLSWARAFVRTLQGFRTSFCMNAPGLLWPLEWARNRWIMSGKFRLLLIFADHLFKFWFIPLQFSSSKSQHTFISLPFPPLHDLTNHSRPGKQDDIGSKPQKHCHTLIGQDVSN